MCLSTRIFFPVCSHHTQIPSCHGRSWLQPPSAALSPAATCPTPTGAQHACPRVKHRKNDTLKRRRVWRTHTYVLYREIYSSSSRAKARGRRFAANFEIFTRRSIISYLEATVAFLLGTSARDSEQSACSWTAGSRPHHDRDSGNLKH
jgi:hypothetical protein